MPTLPVATQQSCAGRELFSLCVYLSLSMADLPSFYNGYTTIMCGPEVLFLVRVFEPRHGRLAFFFNSP